MQAGLIGLASWLEHVARLSGLPDYLPSIEEDQKTDGRLEDWKTKYKALRILTYGSDRK